jgi:DNA-binding transcriptional MocR family regulator
MCRERRAVWKARIDLHRRAGRITDGECHVGQALLLRLGHDGRCDPSHATLADDSGESVSTVQRALRALRKLGMVSWVRRLIRDGWRAAQTSNAYLLSLGEAPEIPRPRCDGQTDRETKSLINQALTSLSAISDAAKAALAPPAGWQARFAAKIASERKARRLMKGSARPG